MNVNKALMMLKDLTYYYTNDSQIECKLNKRLKRALGRTKSRRNYVDCWPVAIELNYNFVLNNHEVHVIETILHEIAHALTPGNGHNHVWKEQARELGCQNIGYKRKPNELIDGIAIDYYKQNEVKL